LTIIAYRIAGADQVPDIWFPFGIGVSRTRYIYAILIPVLAVLIVRTMGNFASLRIEVEAHLAKARKRSPASTIPHR
jgi:hypothetical protein